MRPKGCAAVLEDRRRRALALLKERRSLNEVARSIGCAASSVMRWRDAFRRRGPKAIEVRKAPGRPPKLTRYQCRRLVKVLLRGAFAHGYRTDLWTAPRICEVIRKSFGVRYHPDHVGRLMHGLGWSHQKPESRALQRDEEAIARWKKKDWPRLKKRPRGWAPTLSS